MNEGQLEWLEREFPEGFIILVARKGDVRLTQSVGGTKNVLPDKLAIYYHGIVSLSRKIKEVEDEDSSLS